MPESVKDRCTKSHEYVFLLSKSPRYYFDYIAIQEPANYDGRKDTMMHGSTKYRDEEIMPGNSIQSMAVRGHERRQVKSGIKFGGSKYGLNHDAHFQTYSGDEWKPQMNGDIFVRNKRDVWRVSSQPTSEAHFATFPPKLIEPMVLAGCPEGGTVLDPFNGSGTTGIVSITNKRNYIGIELNKEYIDITKRRVMKECDNVAIDKWEYNDGITSCRADMYESVDLMSELFEE